jgi:hypothetical protein
MEFTQPGLTIYPKICEVLDEARILITRLRPRATRPNDGKFLKGIFHLSESKKRFPNPLRSGNHAKRNKRVFVNRIVDTLVIKVANRV